MRNFRPHYLCRSNFVRLPLVIFLLLAIFRARTFEVFSADQATPPFHRVLWNGTVLTTEEWDKVAAMGFTLVHSYGSHPGTFKDMLDQAQLRGIKMIGGAGYPTYADWLKLEVDQSVPGALTELWPHVVHHYSKSSPSLILYGKGLPGLEQGIEFVLDDPSRATLAQLAAELNNLGSGLKAEVLSGKESMPSTHLATAWYGNAAAGIVSLKGSEFAFSEAQFRDYVNTVKDHPALYCFAPFDDPDIRPFSPAFQRYAREKIRSWAPKVPVYLLVSDLGRSGGSFEHDHKIAPEVFDGFILYSYPHDWEGAGTWRDLNSLRNLLVEWTRSPHSRLSKEIIHLVSAFSIDGSPWTIPPKHGIRMEWDATVRSDVPLAGFGYYTWDGGSTEIGNSDFLQEEVKSVNAFISSNHLSIFLDASAERIEGSEADVTFRAGLRGGAPPFLVEWDFADGAKAWGLQATHHFADPGNYEVKLTVRDQAGRQFSRTTSIHLLGPGVTLVQRDFNNGSAEGFSAATGDWAVVEGAYRQTNPEVPEGRVSLATGAGAQYTVEFDFKLTANRESLSLIYSGAAVDSTYRVQIDPLNDAIYGKEGLTCRVTIMGDSSSTHGYVSIARNESHHLTIDVLQHRVLVSMDDKLVIVSPLLRNGGDGVIGFGSQALAGEFDNLKVVARNPSSFAPTALQITTPQIMHRAAVDYDWTEGTPPGYPLEAADGQQYGGGQDGLRRVDFFQGVRGQGDQSNWRDAGDVSLKYDSNAAGIVITSTSPGDWWNYTFDFPNPQLVRIKAQFAAEYPATCRLFWNDQFISDFYIPPAGASTWISMESPVFSIGTGPGKLRFQVLDGVVGNSFSFAGFELNHVSSPDGDADGIPDLADIDRDGDGFNNADEITATQSDPALAASVPLDTDGDHISNLNDGDDDGDETPDISDPFPLVPNRAPVIQEISPIVVRAGEDLQLPLHVVDTDLPAQSLTYTLDTAAPAGASINATGLLTWRPALDMAASTVPITISVTDDGSPALTSSITIPIRVNPALPTGFEVVNVETSSGLASLLIPRKKYEFTASNRTLFVAKDGSNSNPGTLEQPWQTLAFAIEQLLPGDLLLIRGGDYMEPIDIRRSGTLAKPIVISGYPGERPRITQPDSWAETNPHSSTVTIRDCLHVWFHGLEVEGGWRKGTSIPPGYDRAGISLANEGNRVLNCLISRAFDSGIDARWGSCLAEGNIVLECGNTGILLNNSSPGRSWARGNVVYKCPTGINANFGDGAFIYNNTIIDPVANGISLSVASKNIVAHNVVIHSRRAGISFGGDSASNLLVNNIIWDSAPRHLLFDEYFGTVDGDTLNNTFDNSLLDPTSALSSPPEWFSGWLGSQLIFADPQFLDESGYDFRLQNGSPGRNSARSINLTGAVPVSDLGIFPATEYWEPHLRSTFPSVDEGKEIQFILDFLRSYSGITQVNYSWIGTPPPGMTLDSATGVIAWLPGEQQGPADYEVHVQATVNDSPLLSAISAIHFTVREVNSKPKFSEIPAQLVAEGQPFKLNLAGFASDPDSPAQQLIYSLAPDAPLGVSIDPATGLLSWTPTEEQGPGTYSLTVSVTDNGTPALSESILVPIRVNEQNSAPSLAAIENQTLSEKSLFSIQLIATDSDLPANQLNYALDPGAPAGMTIDAETGALSWSPAESQGPATYIIGVRVHDGGVPPLTASQSFHLTVTEVNSPPTLALIPDQSLDEQTSLALQASATDLDLPSNQITYSLEPGFPPGLTISPSTGLLAWTPSEAQGPGTYTVTVVARDNATPTLADSRSFSITVNDVNEGPFLAEIPDQTIEEENKLIIRLSATDPDLPANELTYSLESTALAGLTIDSSTGEITWTPTEQQGPGTYPLTVKVTDDAIPPLNHSRTFNISVKEANSAPVLAEIPDQTIEEETQFVTQASATDSDYPANQLNYSLEPGSPPGLTIDSNTGLVTWTPSEQQGPATYPVTLRITDNGIPPLSQARSFMISVNEKNRAPVLAEITNSTVDEQSLVTIQASATDDDLPANQLSYSLQPGAPAQMVIDPATGLITWTPTEAQGPASYEVTVLVSDNGTPPLSQARSFMISVNEKNAAPILAEISDASVDEETTLSVQTSGTDSDLPPNHLTYSLEPGSPPGMLIDSTTGLVTWTPTEGQGPGTFMATVKITDDGVPALAHARIFNINVNEINEAPMLAEIPDQTTDEQYELRLLLSATDSDLPPNQLNYSLEPGAPEGMALDSSTGLLTWTPTEQQGPGTFPVSVRVRDDATPALTASRNFSILVKEVNTVPVIGDLPDQTVPDGGTLTLQIIVSDSDFPSNILQFTLLPPVPEGMVLDSVTGNLTWTPGASQRPGVFNIAVQVSDGTAAVTKTFQATTEKENVEVTIDLRSLTLQPEQISFSMTASVGISVTVEGSPDLKTWTALKTILTSSENESISLPRSEDAGFYRIRVEP